MEDRSEFNFEKVPSQEPFLVQEAYVPIKHASNPLPIGIEPIQLVQPKLVEQV
jgi:hypothetical protein